MCRPEVVQRGDALYREGYRPSALYKQFMTQVGGLHCDLRGRLGVKTTLAHPLRFSSSHPRFFVGVARVASHLRFGACFSSLLRKES